MNLLIVVGSADPLNIGQWVAVEGTRKHYGTRRAN
jgi:hypothetical protein